MNSKHPSFVLCIALLLPLFVSFFPLSKTCLVYDIICLLIPPIIMLFELLSLQHGSIKALLSTGSRWARTACRAAPVNSVSTEVGINIFRPIQMIQGWCRLLLQITLCSVNAYTDVIIWNTHKECKWAQWHWKFKWLWMCERIRSVSASTGKAHLRELINCCIHFPTHALIYLNFFSPSFTVFCIQETKKKNPATN